MTRDEWCGCDRLGGQHHPYRPDLAVHEGRPCPAVRVPQEGERQTLARTDGSTVEVKFDEVVPADSSLDQHAIPSGIVVCYSTCWGCKFGDCNSIWHSWADSEDVLTAKAAGLENPLSQQCGCSCQDGVER